MITPLFEKLHDVDIANLVAGRITQHTLFRAMQRVMEISNHVPIPSSPTSNVIPLGMHELADVLNDLLEYAEAYQQLHPKPTN